MSLGGGPLFSAWCLNAYVMFLASVLYGGLVRAGPTRLGTKGPWPGVRPVQWGMVADNDGKNPRTIHTGG